MINQKRIQLVLVYTLVAFTLLTAIYCFASLWSGYNVEVISGSQVIVIALGLSAIALAALTRSNETE